MMSDVVVVGEGTVFIRTRFLLKFLQAELVLNKKAYMY
jgi:hypothetical protein